jgi:putative nucleotidyltransferase with HDIG domain
MLPSVALEIHELSCRPDIDTDKLTGVLERDPMLAGHVLKVANSPMFRGQDAETSLRTAVLRLGLKSLGEIVFELALNMRVFRSREYSGIMEQLRRHSTACANLCRVIGARVGLDPENAFLCGLLHDIGIAAILIVLGERNKSEAALDASVLSEVVRQTHEEVSAMLVRLWKVGDGIAEVVSHHHASAGAVGALPLSALVALCDALASKYKFSVDLGAGSWDGGDEGLAALAAERLGLHSEILAEIEKEVVIVLRKVDATLQHTSNETASEPPSESKAAANPIAPPNPSAKVAPRISARRDKSGFIARALRALLRAFR